MILAGSSGKTTLAESVQSGVGFPPTASAPVATQASKFVLAVGYVSTVSTTGTIVAVANGTATGEPKLAGKGVQFVGTVAPSGNGQVDWVCRAAVSGVTGSITATMEDKFLPASCK
ncbi:MAG: pilin [Rhodoferax sp.]|nr:pilin [Rhodoferax sp.]